MLKTSPDNDSNKSAEANHLAPYAETCCQMATLCCSLHLQIGHSCSLVGVALTCSLAEDSV
jgi:hypothetical protein